MTTRTARAGRTSRRMLPAFLIAAATALAACGTGGGSGDAQQRLDDYCRSEKPDLTGKQQPRRDKSVEGKLTLWGWYNLVPKAVVKDFQKVYPNVELDFVDFSLEDTHTKLLTALNSGTGAPDISMVQDRDGPRFHRLDLLDLRECVGRYRETFPDYKWSKVVTPENQIQAVPWEAGPVMLVYRKDIFDRYGIDPASIETWDDYIDAGKEIVRRSDGKTRMLISNTSNNPSGTPAGTADYHQILTQQLGGTYFTKKGQVTVDSPQAAKALALMKRFRDEGITMNDLASAQAEFATMREGTVATYIGATYWRFWPTENAPGTKGKWGAIPLPAFEEGGVRASNRGGTSIAITGQTESPEAAWAFLRFWLLHVDSRKEAYRAGSLFENIFEPAAKDPSFQQPDPFFDGLKWLELSSEVAAEAPPFPEGPGVNALEKELISQVPAYYKGEKTAGEVLSRVNETTQSKQ